MRKIIVSLLLTLTAASSHGDVIAHYQLGGETLTVSYKDEQHIRIDSSRGGYSLINGEQAIAVIEKAGAQLVLDVDDISAVLDTVQGSGSAELANAADIALSNTGETEVVAGISGKRFIASHGNQRYALVLSDHPDLITASDALARFSRRFAGNLKHSQAGKIADFETLYRSQKYRGLLSANGDVQLTALKTGSRPLSFYQPPKQAIRFKLPQFGQAAK